MPTPIATTPSSRTAVPAASIAGSAAFWSVAGVGSGFELGSHRRRRSGSRRSSCRRCRSDRRRPLTRCRMRVSVGVLSLPPASSARAPRTPSSRGGTPSGVQQSSTASALSGCTAVTRDRSGRTHRADLAAHPDGTPIRTSLHVAPISASPPSVSAALRGLGHVSSFPPDGAPARTGSRVDPREVRLADRHPLQRLRQDQVPLYAPTHEESSRAGGYPYRHGKRRETDRHHVSVPSSARGSARPGRGSPPRRDPRTPRCPLLQERHPDHLSIDKRADRIGPGSKDSWTVTRCSAWMSSTSRSSGRSRRAAAPGSPPRHRPVPKARDRCTCASPPRSPSSPGSHQADGRCRLICQDLLHRVEVPVEPLDGVNTRSPAIGRVVIRDMIGRTVFTISRSTGKIRSMYHCITSGRDSSRKVSAVRRAGPRQHVVVSRSQSGS